MLDLAVAELSGVLATTRRLRLEYYLLCVVCVFCVCRSV